MVSLLFFNALPFGIPAFAQHLQFALLPPAIHDQTDGVPAHTGAKPLHIGDPKRADHALERIFHQFGFGPSLRSLPFSPFLEFAVSPSPGGKKKRKPQSCIKDMARYLQYKCWSRFAVPINDFLDPTVGGIQRSIEKPPYLLPAGKPMIPHLLCCQGIGIVDYCLTLDALHLRHPRLLQRWGKPREDIMLAPMPTRGTGFQGFVVVLLALFNDSFQADVSADLMAMMVA